MSRNYTHSNQIRTANQIRRSYKNDAIRYFRDRLLRDMKV